MFPGIESERHRMATAIIEPASVTVFLNQLLDEGGGAAVDPEVRTQMLNDLRSRLENRIFTTILTKLPGAELPTFEKLVTQPAPPTEIETYLRAKLPNFDELIAESLLSFRKMYVSADNHA